MRLKKIYFLMIVSMIIPLFSGCWDKVELEELGYAAAIGIDKGKVRNLRVTFQVTNPRTIAPGGQGISEKLKKSEIISIDCPEILSGRELMTVASTRRITLSHAKVIIVGEDFAKTDTFFNFLEASLRDKEMRRVMTLIVTRERAEEFIRSNNPILEDRMHKYYEFMSRRWKDTGLVPPFPNINRFMQRTEGKSGLFLSIYGTAKEMVQKEGADEGAYLPGQINREGGNPAEMIGAAVFRNGKMIGTLTGNEMRLVSFLREKPEATNMVVTFEDPLDPQYRFGAMINREARTKVKIDVEGQRPKIDVTVPLSMDILAIPSFINYPEDRSKQEQLKNHLEKYLAKISMQLVKKTQREFKGDPFLWELVVRKKFLTYDEYQKYDWMEHYPEAVVNIKYDLKIRSFGKQLNPPSEPEKNGEVENKTIQ